jgi:outer membrane protein
VIRIRRGFWAAGLALATVSGLGAQSRAESLADAISLAYQTNPTLQNQRAQLRITNETYVQARAGYRPQVNAQVSGTRQDYAGLTTNSASALVIATQPLYSGGRTAAAVGATEADILSGQEVLRQTEGAVLQSVVVAYADVLRDQEGVATRTDTLTALLSQLKETEARANVGDLTRTDVAQSQGFVAQSRVDLASAKAQLEVSRANYAAAVGKLPGLLDPLPPVPNMPASLDEAFSTAEAANPALRSGIYGEEAARFRTAQARDQRLPSLSLQAQIGATGPTSTYLPDIYARSTSATVTFTQPLFAGGVINSQVRQQVERENAARIQTEMNRRTMVQQLGQAWSQLLAARENITNATDEVTADQTAYVGAQKERQIDLRSTLEVFYIAQSLENARLAQASAQHDAYVASVVVLNQMGLLQAKALVPDLESYDPVRAFAQVRGQGSVPWESIPAALDHLTAPTLTRLPPPPTTPVAPSPARGG